MIEHNRRAVADERVTVSIGDARKRPADIPIASNCGAHDSAADCFGWNIVSQAIHRVFGEQVIVAPGIFIYYPYLFLMVFDFDF